MDKYEVIQLIESAKINFTNSKQVPWCFDLAMDQLSSAVELLEKEEE